MKISAFIVIIFFLLSSCTTLKSYEMVYVNDPEMQMGGSAGKNFEIYIETIREGDNPSDGNKASGGCGCN